MVDFANKTKGKEVGKQEAPQLPAIPEPTELGELFKESFEGIAPNFLTIKIPTGGVPCVGNTRRRGA